MADDEQGQSPKTYSVGYGKPPLGSRFQKGKSGNPSGRRKGSLNFTTIFSKALNRMVVVNENGKRRKLSKLQVVAERMVNKAVQGDLRSITHVSNLALNIEQNLERNPGPPAGMSEPDKKTMASLRERIIKSLKE
jgi:hypothetical protein